MALRTSRNPDRQNRIGDVNFRRRLAQELTGIFNIFNSSFHGLLSKMSSKEDFLIFLMPLCLGQARSPWHAASSWMIGAPLQTLSGLSPTVSRTMAMVQGLFAMVFGATMLTLLSEAQVFPRQAKGERNRTSARRGAAFARAGQASMASARWAKRP